MTVELAGVPYLTMADSINASDLRGIRSFQGSPFDAFAGYDNGNWADFEQITTEHPSAHLLDFTVWLAKGTGGDFEPGDMDPSLAVKFVTDDLIAGIWRPVLYGGCSWLDEITANLEGAGFQRSQFRLVSAHYGTLNGKPWPHICGPTSCGLTQQILDGTQWVDWGNVGGPNFDESILRADFFGTPPAPPNVEPQEADMLSCFDPTSEGSWGTDPDGTLYAFNGAPYIAGLNQHPDYRAGSSESGGKNPCVGIEPFRDKNGEIGICFFTFDWAKDPDGSPFHKFRFARNGQPD